MLDITSMWDLTVGEPPRHSVARRLLTSWVSHSAQVGEDQYLGDSGCLRLRHPNGDRPASVALIRCLPAFPRAAPARPPPARATLR